MRACITRSRLRAAAANFPGTCKNDPSHIRNPAKQTPSIKEPIYQKIQRCQSRASFTAAHPKDQNDSSGRRRSTIPIQNQPTKSYTKPRIKDQNPNKTKYGFTRPIKTRSIPAFAIQKAKAEGKIRIPPQQNQSRYNRIQFLKTIPSKTSPVKQDPILRSTPSQTRIWFLSGSYKNGSHPHQQTARGEGYRPVW